VPSVSSLQVTSSSSHANTVTIGCWSSKQQTSESLKVTLEKTLDLTDAEALYEMM